mmetsp:Transcript_3018/g.3241  ORF Transcript_3018/g.3241 Transcript_3018/m.3241 type:complete len:180 (-) Transcript_3018:152-691(-)
MEIEFPESSALNQVERTSDNVVCHSFCYSVSLGIYFLFAVGFLYHGKSIQAVYCALTMTLFCVLVSLSLKTLKKRTLNSARIYKSATRLALMFGVVLSFIYLVFIRGSLVTIPMMIFNVILCFSCWHDASKYLCAVEQALSVNPIPILSRERVLPSHTPYFDENAPFETRKWRDFSDPL